MVYVCRQCKWDIEEHELVTVGRGQYWEHSTCPHCKHYLFDKYERCKECGKLCKPERYKLNLCEECQARVINQAATLEVMVQYLKEFPDTLVHFIVERILGCGIDLVGSPSSKPYLLDTCLTVINKHIANKDFHQKLKEFIFEDEDHFVEYLVDKGVIEDE